MIEMINLSNNISQQDTHSIHGNLDNNDIQSNISNQDIIHGNLGNYGEGSYIANTTVHPTSPVKSHRMTSLHEHNMVRPIMINSHGNQYGNQHVNQLGNQGNQHVNQLGNQGNQLVNQLGNQGNQLVNQLGNQGNQHVNQLGNQGNQHVNQLGNQGNQHVNQLGNQGNQHVNQLGNQGNQHVNQLGNQQVNQLGNQGNQHGNQYGNVHGNQYGIQHGNHGNQAMVSGNWGNQAAGIINGALASAIINAGISPSSVDQRKLVIGNHGNYGNHSNLQNLCIRSNRDLELSPRQFLRLRLSSGDTVPKNYFTKDFSPEALTCCYLYCFNMCLWATYRHKVQFLLLTFHSYSVLRSVRKWLTTTDNTWQHLTTSDNKVQHWVLTTEYWQHIWNYWQVLGVLTSEHLKYIDRQVPAEYIWQVLTDG